MNIILISEERLKVVLTDRDLDSYGIRLEDIDYDNTKTRRVFWTILDKAKTETGFDAAISRIFIQIYPDTHGGCEMYVSRIGERENERKSSDRIRFTVGKRTESAVTEYLYRFEATDQLIAACRALLATDYTGESQAFVQNAEYGRECYLLIKAEEKQSLRLSEYGSLCKGKYDKSRVREYCSVICDTGAVQTLGRL